MKVSSGAKASVEKATPWPANYAEVLGSIQDDTFAAPEDVPNAVADESTHRFFV
jgi:hypothetical protein